MLNFQKKISIYENEKIRKFKIFLNKNFLTIKKIVKIFVKIFSRTLYLKETMNINFSELY